MGDKYGVATEQGANLTLDHEVDKEGSGLTFDNVIIEGDRWGSSGYYPATVLERDGAKVFKAGTQIHIDHTEDGKTDSAGTLIGELAEDARYVVEEDGTPVLRAPMHFYATGIHNADWVKERAKRLGVSIRSGVTFMDGTRAGRKGRIVTSFTEAISVDVVSRAGAGGKFGRIKESAHPASAHEEHEKGTPVEKEEIEAIGKAAALAVAEVLAKPLGDIATAVGEVKVAQESAGQPKPLTASETASEITKAKLSDTASARIWAVYEAKGDVRGEIAREEQIRKEAVAEAQKGLGNVQFDEHGQPVTNEQTVKESGVSAWKTAKAGD